MKIREISLAIIVLITGIFAFTTCNKEEQTNVAYQTTA
jgi:hypothetical protein